MIPYSGRFSLVQKLAEICPDLQKKLPWVLFLQNKCMIRWAHPYSWWPHPTCELKKWRWTTKQRRKIVQQQPSLPFVWRPSQLWKYQDCHCGWETGLLNGRIQHCWSQLQQLLSVPYGLFATVYSSMLILLYCDHLEGRQTVENYLVHTGTSSYIPTSTYAYYDVINFHFLWFLFLQKQVCPRKSWKVAPSKNFPLYGTQIIYHSLKFTPPLHKPFLYSATNKGKNKLRPYVVRGVFSKLYWLWKHWLSQQLQVRGIHLNCQNYCLDMRHTST